MSTSAAARSASTPTSVEGVLPVFLRTVVHGICATVLAFPLTVPEAVAFAGTGGLVGALLGQWTARTPVRLPLIWGAAALCCLVGAILRALVVDVDGVVAELGPANALRYGEALQVGAVSTALSLSLRATAVRRPALRALELVYVGVAFAALVVAHRHGAIHRPYDLADPILERGWDPRSPSSWSERARPSPAVSCCSAKETSGRALFHGGVLALGLLLLLSMTAVGGLPTPPIDDDALGLRGGGTVRRGGRTLGEGWRWRRQPTGRRTRFPRRLQQRGPTVSVGVVLFHDDYTPPLGVYYFRQGAFSQYNGRRLVASTRRGVDRDLANAFPASPMRVDPRDPEPWARRKIETTVALLTDHTRPFGLESPLEFRPSVNPDRQRFRRVYRVWSAATELDYGALLGTEMGAAEWDRDVWRHYTEAPEDPRYRALAERIVAEVLPRSSRMTRTPRRSRFDSG